MRLLILGMLVVLFSLALGCEQLARVQDEKSPTATPGQPKEADGSGAMPSTPGPTATPEPTNTPSSVMTPLAVLPMYTPEPTATAVPRPAATAVSSEGAKAQREEYIARCKHWALRNMEPLEYSKFEELDPHNMTDLKRVLWGSVILDTGRITDSRRYYGSADDGVFRFQGDHIEWCQDYWSEPLTPENASKRNHPIWHISCQVELPDEAWRFERDAREAFENYESEDMSAVIVNQYARILNWVDIDRETLLKVEPKPRELVQMVWDREDDGPSRYGERNRISNWPLSSTNTKDIEWWGIEEAWQENWDYCKNYYPQLFYGRWVPLDDFGFDEQSKELQQRLEGQRKRDDWPEWADGPVKSPDVV